MLVDLEVLVKQLALSKGNSADGAGVGHPPAVDLLVAPKRSGSWKALSADAAAEWFDSSVAPHVCLHVLEHFPTDLAGPAPATDGFSVRSQMVCQTV